MFDTQRVAQDFSAAAPRYDAQTPLQERVLSRLLGRLLPQLVSDARLLDAGCGTGRLARLCSTLQVTQLDIAIAMCAKAVMPLAPAVAGTLEELPFMNASFDAVVSSLALQWVNESARAMREMKRVLKPGGRLAVSTFGSGTLQELKESFAAVDTYPHVSGFAVLPEFEEAEVIVEYYPDMLSLMRHLKAMGARNKLLARRKSLMTREQMQRVEEHYRQRFGTPQGLPVTWDIRYYMKKI